MLIHTRDRARDEARHAAADIAGLEAVLPGVRDTSGDNFRIQIQGRHYDSRVDAARALADWAHSSDLKWAPTYASRDYGVIGRISGFDLHLTTHPTLGTLLVDIALDGVPRGSLTVARDGFLDGGVGLIQRIENRVSGIPALLDHARGDLAEAEQTIADTDQRIGQPFRHAAALAAAEEDLTRIDTQLAAIHDGATAAPDPGRPLTVTDVRGHRPALGVQADPTRSVATLGTAPHTPRPAAESRRLGL
jgi:hypothetical protein